VDAVSGRKFPTINPANGKVIAEISEGDKVKFSSSYQLYHVKHKNCIEENIDKINKQL